MIDTYTITFTNGSQTTYTVVNGADGVQGEQGEKGDTGATGKSAYELYCEQYDYEGTLEEWLEIINSEIFNNYTVVFDLNGGTGTADFVRKVTVRSGHSVALTIPEREGYMFLGWYTGEGVNEAQITADNRVSHNMTLTAKWGIKTSTVKFLDYYGDVITEETVNWGEAANAPVPPTVTGYYFLKWDKSFDSITANTTVKALYAPITYTVSFDTNGGSEVATQEVYVGQSPMQPADPYKEGHYFIGWYLDEAFTQPYAFDKALTDGAIVYAYFNESKPIYTAEDLRNIAQDPYGRYYLANDIDLEGTELIPIDYFYGILDGNGYKICNYNLSVLDSGDFGFIRYNYGVIKNLTFSDLIISVNISNASNAVGAVVGVNEESGVIENCRVNDGYMTLYSYYGTKTGRLIGLKVGGVAGTNRGKITETHASVEATLHMQCHAMNNNSGVMSHADTVYNQAYIGGLVGNMSGNAYMADCTAEFTLTAKQASTREKSVDLAIATLDMGSAIGDIADNSVVKNCSAIVHATLCRDGLGDMQSFSVGGFAASVNNDSKITECFASGSISNEGYSHWQVNAGGFIGAQNAYVGNCYATTDLNITATHENAFVGGFAGYHSGTTQNCYSAGSVITSTNGPTGGFAGKNAEGGAINKCFSASNLQTTNYNVSYFVGMAVSASATVKCYYDSNATVTVHGSAYTPEESKATPLESTSLWNEDFLSNTLTWKTDVWDMPGTQLPTLKAFIK